MKYKVLVIELLLKGNRIAKFGEEVEVEQLMSNPETLIKDGFIELLEVVEKKKK